MVLVLIGVIILSAVKRPDPEHPPVGDDGTVVSSQTGSDSEDRLKSALPDSSAGAVPFTPVDTSSLMALPYPYHLEKAFPEINFGRQRPLQVMPAPGDSEHLFVLCQEGCIYSLTNAQDVSEKAMYLDIRDRVCRRGNEEGLLGLAFHPDYETNGELFVCYSAENESRESRSVISRFRRSADAALTADAESEEVLLEVDQPFRTQNGGSLEFGPDGFLYIGLGDGGSANDPQEHGQNLKTLLGSVLRIDVDTRDEGLAYAVPPDNPFVDRGEEARGEIWAYGFRNVWRLAFDKESGELWGGDVGQDRFEEINSIVKGGNYGWNNREATYPFNPDLAFHFPLTEDELKEERSRYVDPVSSYYHSEGRAVIGGRVYHGSRLKRLKGAYIYADFFSGFIWAVSRHGEDVRDRWICNSTQQISGFGEDADGELYLCSLDGSIYRLTASDDYWENSSRRFPYLLSETGLFESTPELTPVEGVRSYSVNVPLWSDGAAKERLIALPADGRITFSETGAWEFPVGTVVIKHFAMDMTKGDPSSRKRLETRLLVNGTRGWDGYTYLWNDEQTDASLMDMAMTMPLEIQTPEGLEKINWYFPSRSDCKACHTRSGGFVLSINARQLNRQHSHDGHTANQLEAWQQAGMFTESLPKDSSKLEAYPDWKSEEEQSVESLARAYLDVNCAFCHTPGGPGNSPIDLRYHTPLERTVLINVPPRGTRTGGEPATALITPNRPGDSELVRRMETRGPGQMPILATFITDETALEIVSEWISQMPPAQ